MKDNSILNTPSPSRVIVADCPSYSAEEVKRALAEIMQQLGGISCFIKPGQTVLIKPNLFTAHTPERAVTTHPALVRQVVQLCEEAGAGRIWVGDSPVGAQDEKHLWLKTGMTEAVRGTRAELKSWRVPQQPLNCGADILAVPCWYPEVDVLISLPKLKAHCLTTISCALKNVYGIVSGEAKLKFHLQYPSPASMSSFLLRVFAKLKPQLNIADAVLAMEGNGPAHGRPVAVGVLIASTDAVALDSAGCKALRTPASLAPMIRLAAEGGLGFKEDSMIDYCGSGLERLNQAQMKPSISGFLRFIPEFAFRASSFLWQLRPKIIKRECVKCGSCVTNCPQKTIIQHMPDCCPEIKQKECIACFCCIESCPEGAIAVQLYLGSLLGLIWKKRKKLKKC